MDMKNGITEADYMHMVSVRIEQIKGPVKVEDLG